MSVTLSEVKRAAKAHRAPLAGESAGYLVLAIADQVLSAPRLVQAEHIQLTEEGALRVLSGHASSDADAELSLRRALDQLLLVASSGSAALTRASRRTAPVGLSALVRELEAALIPVNRAAARRALARVHRETSRALANGVLPAEEVEAPVSVSPAAVSVSPAATQALPVVVAPIAHMVPVAPPEVVEIRAAEPESDFDDEALTRAIPSVSEAEQRAYFDGVLSALCEELPAPPELVESDALTRALQVRSAPLPAAVTEPEPELELEIDVVLEAEIDACESSAAPSVMPLEACTRPEPVVLRKSLRPLAAELPPPLLEPLPRTPTLGSLAAQLPVLGREQLAEIRATELAQVREAARIAALAPAGEAELAEVVTSVSLADYPELTEQMPEVEALAPGVAMVASRKSCVSELLNDFHIAPDDSNEGLCRAIKEMAELDLTPAPFAALIR